MPWPSGPMVIILMMIIIISNNKVKVHSYKMAYMT